MVRSNNELLVLPSVIFQAGFGNLVPNNYLGIVGRNPVLVVEETSRIALK